MGIRGLGSRILDAVSVDRPLWMLAASVAVTLALYAIGLALRALPGVASRYIEAFPAAFAIVFAVSIYGRPLRPSPRRPLRVYAVSMAVAYATLAALAAPPGFYTALASPSTVTQFVGEVESFRSSYTTVPAMALAIFEHNLKIDAISYVPVAGAALFGFSLMETSSLVWAVGATSLWGGNRFWYAYVLSVLLAPATFTEFSSYALAVAGGHELYSALIRSDRGGLWLSLTLMVASVALLYASAVLEAWLIISVGA
ncbi:MAG: hypothetical protein ACP5GT_02420 [Conexivisphaera sp.]